MDKNELIKRLKEQESTLKNDDYPYWEGYDDGIVFALELAEQLEEPETLSEKWIFDNQEMYIVNDTSENAVNVWRLKNLIVPEPEKPVVPSFVADWFEENKDDFEQSIYSLTVYLDRTDVLPRDEFENWFLLSKNKPTETLVKMKLYGYVVKKEKPQVIKVLENLYLAEPLGDTASHRIITTWDLGSAYKFTDQDSINTHLEKFTGAKVVPVEEEEE